MIESSAFVAAPLAGLTMAQFGTDVIRVEMIGGGSVERPVNHVLPAWDVACAHQAAFSVVAAVNRRMRSGEGAEMKLALSDVAFSTLAHLGVLAEAELLGQDRPSIGNDIYGAFGRDFKTADGHRLMVAAISANQWKALVAACGIGKNVADLERRTGVDLSDEEHRFGARDAIAEMVEPWFAARTRAQAEALLNGSNACWGRYSTPTELLATDARVSLSNPLFERIDTSGIGPHLSAGATVRLPAMDRQATSPAPLLGTDTDEVLHEVLRLSGAAIGRLHDAGIVAGPERDPTVCRTG